MQTKQCPHCGQTHPAEAQFCPMTGLPISPQPSFCLHCGREIEAGWRACGYCGKPLENSPMPRPPVAGTYGAFPYPQVPPPSRPRISKKIQTTALIAGIGMVVLCCGIVAVYFGITRLPGLLGNKEKISPKDGMVSVYIPAGEFLMGSTQEEADAALKELLLKEPGNLEADVKKYFDAEVPQHTVYLDAYWIDKTEVTNSMYQKCVAESDCTVPEQNKSNTHTDYYGNPQYANYPVIYVDWNQANTYCAWAGGKLPSEAQWEKATRDTDGRKYPWGNDEPTCNKANYNQGNYQNPKYCVGDTTTVGSYPSGASPYGILDMTGNVHEWVNDWYDEQYYQNSPQKNPAGPSSGQYRVLRGGSWLNESRFVRAASRYRNEPDFRSVNLGFRCVRLP